MSNRQLTPVALREDLRSREEALKNLAPPTLRVDKFIAAAEAWVARKPEVLRCSPESIVSECLKCINDGLVFDGREAALTWFFDKKTKILNAQYMPMVQGILKRLRELGDLTSVECEAVYQADFLEVVSIDGIKRITWKPDLSGADRGFVRAAYAIFKNAQGVTIHAELMLRDEIENARRMSKNGEGEAWTKWYGEMARKTVIRRASKYVPLSDEGRRLVNRDDDFTLLEGKALPAPRAEGDNPLADPSLEDYDDEGNLITQAVDVPIVDARADMVEAEVVAMPERPRQPDRTNAVELDFSEEDDDELFAVARNVTDVAFEQFAKGLQRASSLSEARRIAGSLKEDMAAGSDEQKTAANTLWKDTVARLRQTEGQLAPVPDSAPALAKKKPAQRRRA